jgi:hypothetical protein
MIRIEWWLASLTALYLLWHECAENPGVFCYRIGWGAFASMRSRSLAPVAISADVSRTSAACSNRSFTSCTRSTTLKD